jgi:hypothetical protein
MRLGQRFIVAEQLRKALAVNPSAVDPRDREGQPPKEMQNVGALLAETENQQNHERTAAKSDVQTATLGRRFLGLRCLT